MKALRTSIVIVFSTAAVLAAPPALACPDGQSEGLFGWCYPNCGGDLCNGAEHLKNEIKGQLAGPALSQWLIFSRNSAIGTSQPIPPQIRTQLSGFVDEDILNRARFKIGDNGFLNAGSVVLGINGDVSAITLIDVIVFRNTNDAYYNPELWAHELTHVQQYRNWGVDDFAISYTRDHNTVEGPAYERQRQYVAWQASRNQFPPPYTRQSYPPPPPFPSATVCITPIGTVPLAMPLPLGAACGFMSPYGPVGGVAG